MLQAAGLDGFTGDKGLIVDNDGDALMRAFLDCMRGHRVWSRESGLDGFAA